MIPVLLLQNAPECRTTPLQPRRKRERDAAMLQSQIYQSGVRTIRGAPRGVLERIHEVCDVYHRLLATPVALGDGLSALRRVHLGVLVFFNSIQPFSNQGREEIRLFDLEVVPGPVQHSETRPGEFFQ